MKYQVLTRSHRLQRGLLQARTTTALCLALGHVAGMVLRLAGVWSSLHHQLIGITVASLLAARILEHPQGKTSVIWWFIMGRRVYVARI